MQHFTTSFSSTRSRWTLSLLLAALLMGILLTMTTKLTYAKSLDNFPVQNCAHARSFDQCNNQDPIQQGCAADATTVRTAAILFQGTMVGRLDLRHSNACNSNWGRTFSFVKGGNAELTLDSPSLSELVPDPSTLSLLTGGPDEVYSNMVYGEHPLTLTGQVIFSQFKVAQAQIGG